MLPKTVISKFNNVHNLHVPRHSIHTSVQLYGGVKVKRRKQEMRVENPHLPTGYKDTSPTSQALQNLDQHYQQYYKKRWSSMRLALLSRPKYCAVVNNFAETERTMQVLEKEGCINIGQQFNINVQKYIGQNENNEKAEIKSEEEMKQNIENNVLSNEENFVKDNEKEMENNEDLMKTLSLKVEEAKDRYIDPEDRLVGDMSTAMYDFVPTSSLKGMEDFVEDSEYYSYFKTNEKGAVKIEEYPRLTFPKNLNVFMHHRNVLDLFAKPKVDLTNNLNYYCLDGGSLLPVLALDLAPGDAVLDMCAGPGGKSLLAMQTLLPAKLVCNEINGPRLKRLTSIFEQYFGHGPVVEDLKERVSFSKRPAQELFDYGVYDKIICDVPCFSDRHSITNNEDNMFCQKMIKNRLLLPEQQCELLKAGLQYLKPGGTLVYSTCTLSPVQNEGVVNMALKSLAEETTLQFVVNDLTQAVKPLGFMGRFYGKFQGVALGNLLVPHLSNNFGPTYFCRITRKT